MENPSVTLSADVTENRNEKSVESVSQTTVFESTEFGTVRTIEENGKILFCGKDVATALGYAAPSKAICDHCKGVTKIVIPSKGGKQETSFITEGDVYRLIASSKLESAQKFESWVFDEVLPTLRKTGTYTVQQVQPIQTKSDKELDLLDKQISAKRAEFLHALADEYAGKSQSYKQILDAYATKELSGEFLLPLPATKKTYSATEIAEKLGINANKVGKIANANNLKTAEFGEWVKDKAAHCSKEVETFRYYENVIEEMRKHI